MSKHSNKWLYLLILCILSSAVSYSQKIEYKSFRQSLIGETNTKEHYKCAVILINGKFNKDQFTITSTPSSLIKEDKEEKNGKRVLYISLEAKEICIDHKQLQKPFKYVFPYALMEGKTYELVLEQEDFKEDHSAMELPLFVESNAPNTILRIDGYGEDIILDEKSKSKKIHLPQGKYNYTAQAYEYYEKKGEIEINKISNELKINLKPFSGRLKLRLSPSFRLYIVSIDGEQIKSYSEPIELKKGEHKIKVEHNMYVTVDTTITIEKDQLRDLNIKPQRLYNFSFSSNQAGTKVYVDERYIGEVPLIYKGVEGRYLIRATKPRYIDFKEEMYLSGSNEGIIMPLKKKLNYKNEFYIEGNIRSGASLSYGGTIGCYLANINIEASYLYGNEKSELIYWTKPTNTPPQAYTYSPLMNISGKIGYGIPISRRLRITPQVGAYFLKLTETADIYGDEPIADGAFITSGLASIRFSLALVNHLGISITPEYYMAMNESKGYTSLAQVSPKIKKWGEGFNIKLGLNIFF